MARNYDRGAAFERKVRDHLEGLGYAAVRSAGSHSPTDVVACRADQSGVTILFVQCKTNGRLDPEEWNDFIDFCETGGAVPLLAKKGKGGRGIIYSRLTGRKDGGGRQPLAPWEP